MDAGRVKGDKGQLTLIYLFLELNIVYIELIVLSWSAGDDDGRQSRARRQDMKMDAGRVEADKIMKMDADAWKATRNLFVRSDLQIMIQKKMTMYASRVEGGSGKVSFSNISRIKHHCLQIMKDNGVVAESGGKVA
ncbi:hypothetical protein OS493_003906 [Desmophyllum pertusum]|uniref:Uncharacterized protein n=1 Tax=Desmophyllum pertusum TaxID=174260 RepID=A0A9W9ZTU0_9CNID|nr:hypothetical protein OS493_003906 [Desmophyllum pertusum]